jgi:hypothetical protein
VFVVPTILFISEACLLDRKSGAAQSVRAQLKALARAGWQAHAATLTLFDGDTEYPRAMAHPALHPLPPAGSTVVLDDEGVTHTLCVTHSSRQKAARPWELRAYTEQALQVLDRVQPDVLLTYSSALLQPLLAQAQQRGARTVFYVGNPGYAKAGTPPFRFVDAFVMPSQAMVALYREKLGTDAQVVRTPAYPRRCWTWWTGCLTPTTWGGCLKRRRCCWCLRCGSKHRAAWRPRPCWPGCRCWPCVRAGWRSSSMVVAFCSTCRRPCRSITWRHPKRKTCTGGCISSGC